MYFHFSQMNLSSGSSGREKSSDGEDVKSSENKCSERKL